MIDRPSDTFAIATQEIMRKKLAEVEIDWDFCSAIYEPFKDYIAAVLNQKDAAPYRFSYGTDGELAVHIVVVDSDDTDDVMVETDPVKFSDLICDPNPWELDDDYVDCVEDVIAALLESVEAARKTIETYRSKAHE